MKCADNDIGNEPACIGLKNENGFAVTGIRHSQFGHF
jgi:hypothetical protein